jgi:molybdenum cofactor cytidylyltransferase
MNGTALRTGGAYSFAVVLLAAGRSQRMGQPKLLLPWNQTSILGHLLAQWQDLGAEQIVVVHAAGDLALGAELSHLKVPQEHRISNPTPEHGMFGSIQCAARWAGWRGSLTHWAIVLGDQPHLRRDTLRAVLALSGAQPDKVCQPAKSGHHRHPALFPKAVFAQLANTAAPNLKEFLKSLPGQVVACELDDPGLELDIDRPGDYEKALELARAKS